MAPQFDIAPEQVPSPAHFLYTQFLETKPGTPTREDEDLSGQTAIVTGGNTGIGLDVARILLDLGLSKLILGVRNVEGGEAHNLLQHAYWRRGSLYTIAGSVLTCEGEVA